jgi:oligoendopeptidase F
MEERQKTREEIGEEFKWNLGDLFASNNDWTISYNEILNSLNQYEKFKGKLANPQTLLEVLDGANEISGKASRIYVYANMKLHEDSNVSLYQGFADMADSMMTKLSIATSFIEAEIITLDSEVINDDRLIKYKHYMENLLREKEHILTQQLEEMLAATGEISQAADNIFAMINNADMKFRNVKDDKGNEIELTHGKYISLLESENAEVRKEAYNAYYDSFMNQKNTLAATYNASVKQDVFYARVRKYNSSLEYSLSIDNIPKEVYLNLIKTVNKNLPLLHKYVDIRRELLGLDEIHVYDLYTPIVKNIKKEVSYEYSKKMVLESLAPLGEEYVSKVAEGFEKGWIDVYENKGKRSGAYSWGTQGCHPYVLLNFDNKINDMFTLAHEIGHAMHSYYTWENQINVYADYTIFVAEVASTVNESLLMKHLIKITEDKEEKRYLINYFVEQFRGTIFRQTMFAEFEMITHEMVEKDEPLTVETLSKLYKDLTRKYYGENIVLDEKVSIEWARIPHFYNAFYVFQYATGFSAAITLSYNILNEGQSAVDDYLSFLKSGSSDYSINILKKAGVDMSSQQPIEEALKVYEELLESLV